MTHDAAVLKAQEIASCVLSPAAGQNDKAGKFSTDAVESLGGSGLLGLLLPVDFGGSGLGLRTFATVAATLAEALAEMFEFRTLQVRHSSSDCRSAQSQGHCCRPQTK